MTTTAASHKVTLAESAQLQIIKTAAARHGIDWRTLLGVYGTESGYGQNEGPSSTGAMGPFQFEPGTARTYRLANPWDFVASAEAAAHYLSDLGADGNVNSAATAKALNHYSGGAGDTYVTKVKLLGQGMQKTIAPNSSVAAAADTVKGIANAPGDAAKAVAGAVGSIGSFLTDPQTWLRLAEIVLGGALLLMGLKSFTGGAIDPVGAAGRVARLA